jgi:hypothetical protein
MSTVTDNFDVSFIMGDMNYRIDTEINNLDKLLSANKIRELYKFDQLSNEKLSGRLEINGFEEEKINFLPTYKFVPGDDAYTYHDDVKLPGWTDRIL